MQTLFEFLVALPIYILEDGYIKFCALFKNTPSDKEANYVGMLVYLFIILLIINFVFN